MINYGLDNNLFCTRTSGFLLSRIIIHFAQDQMLFFCIRKLKRGTVPNDSFFSWYSLALRGFCVEENRLLTFKVNKLPRRKETRKSCGSTEKLNHGLHIGRSKPYPFNSVNFKVDNTLMVSSELILATQQSSFSKTFILWWSIWANLISSILSWVEPYNYSKSIK